MSKLGKFRGKGLLAFLFGALAFLAFAAGASAQTAGKIEGTVTDRDTGQPLPGAQVIVSGTQLGNISDDNGYYFINNVPAGAQTISASFLGYQAESGQYRILAGQTTTVDFSLSTEVIVADSAIVTVTEREPLVPRDNTISKSHFIKENVQDLPLASIDNLIELAAGASLQQGGISLRGARPDDATVYVDGLNATDYANVSSTAVGRPTAGGERSPLEFSQFSIEQLDVVTGGADASLGDAQSGVVNIVTSRGGSALSGNLRFTTDAVNIERTDDSYGLAGNIGGPLLPNGRASFFLSGTVQGSRGTNDTFGFDPTFSDIVELGRELDIDVSRDQICDGANCFAVRPDLPLRSIDTFVVDFLQARDPEFLEANRFFFDDGNDNATPGVFSDRYAFTGKLAFTPTSTTDIQLSYSRSRDQGNTGTVVGDDNELSFDPFNNEIDKETVNFAVGSWRQIFYQEADRSLAVEARVGYFDDQFKRGAPFDLCSPGCEVEGATDFPLLGDNGSGADILNFNFSDYELFFEDSIQSLLDGFDGENTWENIETIRQALTIADRIPVTPATVSGRADVFGFGNFSFPLPQIGFPRGDILQAGADFDVNNRERRWNVRSDIDAQISRIDRLTGGVDLKFFDIDRLAFGQGNRLFNTAYFVNPRLFGFYATNRIDLGDFVVDLGGRVDRFDHNTLLPELPGIARVDLDGDGSTLREYDTKTAFAPRLGVAHPVTENTQVRVSYGVFNQLPDLSDLYQHVTSDINANDLNTNAIVGNPDLDFQQTKSFELGITHLLTEDLVLDLVAYNRDIEKGVAARQVVYPQAGGIRQLFNVNNGNVRGLDLTLTKRFSDYWSADVTYSFLDSKVSDSDQNDFTFNQGFNNTTDIIVDAPAVPLPADFDVTHKVASTFSLRFPKDFAAGSTWGDVFQNFGLFATARFNSGFPFTRQTVATAVFIEPLNSSRRRSDFQTDVRATKYFEVASDVEIGAIFEIFNLFNNENFTTNQQIPFGEQGVNNGVFNTTGSQFTGRERFDASTQVTDDIILADLDESTAEAQAIKEFRGFTDIDGDGVVTREEQLIMATLAIGAENKLQTQPKRSYRLGVELRF